MTSEPETVDELRPDMGGRWLVTTRGSTHVWDLNAGTYERRPGPSSEGGPMQYDREAHRVTGVTCMRRPVDGDWERVVDAWVVVGGRTFVLYDDPADFLLEQWRLCSQVQSIERLPDLDDS